MALNLVTAATLLAAGMADAHAESGWGQTTGQAFATVARPLGMSERAELSFGSLAVSGVHGGTVSVSPDGKITANGVIIGDPGEAHSASFAMLGDGSQAYTIILPARVLLTDRNGAIHIETFTHNAGPLPLIGRGGLGAFNIGATLRFEDKLPASGVYFGSVLVVISNN